MSNMSYCRFHNTRRDMRDCINALEEMETGFDDGKLSLNESREGRLMFEEIIDFLDGAGIDIDVDTTKEQVNEMFDNVEEKEE